MQKPIVSLPAILSVFPDWDFSDRITWSDTIAAPSPHPLIPIYPFNYLYDPLLAEAPALAVTILQDENMVEMSGVATILSRFKDGNKVFNF